MYLYKPLQYKLKYVIAFVNICTYICKYIHANIDRTLTLMCASGFTVIMRTIAKLISSVKPLFIYVHMFVRKFWQNVADTGNVACNIFEMLQSVANYI